MLIFYAFLMFFLLFLFFLTFFFLAFFYNKKYMNFHLDYDGFIVILR